MFLPEEADKNSLIENREFDNAIILGPAVVVLLENVTLSDNSFASPDVDSLFIELQEDREVVGVIGLKNVSFRDCQFQNVAIAGTRDSLAALRKGFAENAPTYSAPSVPSAGVR